MRMGLLAGCVAAVALGGAPVVAGAQGCAGDCDGDGEVTVSEVILAVNIVLTGSGLDGCPALVPGGGVPGVSHLIAAVNSVLCGCMPCPPPPPTRAATPTATRVPPTPTVTSTPTATPVVSRWIEDTYKLKGSSCPKSVNDAVRSSLPGQTASYLVREQQGQAQVELGDGSLVLGTVDEDGVLHLGGSGRQMEGSCTIFSEQTLDVSLRSAQSTATYHYHFTTSGCPRSITCSLTITARWRATAGVALRRGADLAARLRRAVVSP